MQLGRNICSPYISLPNINSYRHYIINHVISKSNILYVRLPKLEGIKLNISGVFTILLITSQLKLIIITQFRIYNLHNENRNSLLLFHDTHYIQS